MAKFEEKTIDSKDIYDGKILKLRLDTVELPDGSSSKREIVEHSGGVAVVAVTDSGELLMVRQYRKAMEKELLELPAGKLEAGEDPLECAERELREETGYKAGSIELLSEFYTAPGFCSEKVYVYIAKELEFVGEALDEGEFLEVEKYRIEELGSLLSELQDAKSIIGVMHLMREKEVCSYGN
ncbi:ADP-ribose pyrophosphatase [Andreesenia angusta]|uniref:ADP-ribose pyrophosphatase n=1 Tax=Andreesenia angusta TaxID=39480 RepID=A0A1S1V991_9FIRM|nr:NUDIX hydrolase [Andreesenia angusta]OHW62975.1 ADP-ribose pyrophosphatase [Andreesenia angusta]